MRMMKLAAIAAAMSLCSAAASAENLVFMTGPSGGSWYPLGGAMKNILEENIPDLSIQIRPGAGLVNLKGVQDGKADLGFGMLVSTVDAVHGREPFDTKYDNICHLASLNPNYMQNMTIDMSIGSMKDVKGKRLTTVPVGNTAELATRAVLAAVGMTYDDLDGVNHSSVTDSVNMMKDGQARVFMTITSVPNGSIIDLTNSTNTKFIPISDGELSRMKEQNAGWSRLYIPAGSYPGVDEDVPTVGFPAHVFGSCNLPDETAYNITKALSENISDLGHIVKELSTYTAKELAQDPGIPYHPGAERYYGEAGAL